MSGTTTQVTTPGGAAGSPSSVPLPLGAICKAAAADPKTTNALLAVLVLCMSGLMPEQLQTVCGL